MSNTINTDVVNDRIEIVKNLRTKENLKQANQANQTNQFSTDPNHDKDQELIVRTRDERSNILLRFSTSSNKLKTKRFLFILFTPTVH